MKYLMFETEQREIVFVNSENCSINRHYNQPNYKFTSRMFDGRYNEEFILTVSYNDDGVKKLLDFFETVHRKYVKQPMKILDYKDMKVTHLYGCFISNIQSEDNDKIVITFTYDYIEDNNNSDILEFWDVIKARNRDQKLTSIGI